MSNNNQPDWHKMAAKFDLWLPLIAPVGDAMLSELKVSGGEKVLDIASGTGEPALTLAKQQLTITVEGVDAAEGMINVAKAKVEKEKLTNISFSVMPAEKLDYADNSFDHITCRFGVMLFADPLAGLKEMHRVLKPSGTFVIAVWGDREKMPTMNWSYNVFKGRVPDEDMPPLGIVTSLGASGVIDAMLNEAGFDSFKVKRHFFDYQFDSFDEYWSLLETSDILKRQFDVLPETEHIAVKSEIAALANEFIGESGLTVPHEYVLVSGNK